MATTYYYPDLMQRGTSLRPIVANIPTLCQSFVDNVLEVGHQVVDFIDMWICCNGVDDETVIENVQRIVEPNDHLAEEFVEFTHSPKRRHRTQRPADVDIFNNELPLTRQQKQQLENKDGNFVDRNTAPAIAAEMVTPQHAEAVGAIVVYRYADDTVVIGYNDRVETPRVEEINRPAEDEELVAPSASLVYTICQDAIEVKSNRRIATNGRKFYEASVVREIKNKLGVPKYTEANKQAVRRAAENIMRKHGVRPTHIGESIEKIIVGVFIPDRFDIEAAKMMASNTAANIRDEYHNAGPENGWTRLSNFFRFGNGRRGASRVPPVAGSP